MDFSHLASNVPDNFLEPLDPILRGEGEGEIKPFARNLVLERILGQRGNLLLEELVCAGPNGLVAPVVKGQERGEEVAYTLFVSYCL